jgi:hypothetical protein
MHDLSPAYQRSTAYQAKLSLFVHRLTLRIPIKVAPGLWQTDVNWIDRLFA